MDGYQNLANAPAFASRGAQGSNYNMRPRQVPGNPGGNLNPPMCSFPAPPPHRVYCMQAPFAQTDGRPYFPLVVAYGHSRPAVIPKAY